MDFTVKRMEAGAVFTITRPERLNALNGVIWDGLEACMNELEHDGCRYLVITAEGNRAFSAGSDLKDNVGLTWEERPAKNDRVRNLLLRLSRSALFTVAAINGLAYGGGLELALACTVRLAVSDAKFSMPEIRLAAIPSYGGTQFLPEVIGRARAAEIMLTGRVLEASQALAWGLVGELVETEAILMERALRLGQEVASFSPVAYGSILRCLDVAGNRPDQQTMDVEGAEVRTVLASDDAKEDVAAFNEKRKPVFNGC